MEAHELLIRFDNTSQAQANQYASELQEDLLDLYLEDVSIEVVKEAEGTMDFGTTLAVVLGTPAVIALAKGIQVWLSKRPAAEIRIVKKKPDGEIVEIIVVAEDSQNLSKIAEALQAAF